jgi:hypothetical protein
MVYDHRDSHVIIVEAFTLHSRVLSFRTYNCAIPIFQRNVWTPTTAATAIGQPAMGDARK